MLEKGFVVKCIWHKIFTNPLLLSSAVYGIAQIYHSRELYEEAYPYYRKASQDEALKYSEIGRTALFMVARYVQNYYSTASLKELDSVSLSDAFNILLDLAQKEQYHAAYFWVADCYERGLGITKSTEDALTWYQLAADQCLDMTVESERRIARLRAGPSRSEDLECIPEESESDAGTYQSLVTMINIKHTNQFELSSKGSDDLSVSIIPEDRRQDIDWLKLQADQGLSEAMYYLARNYADCGDEDSAFEYFEKAAEMDHIDSIRELGKCFHRGRGCVRDVLRAVQLYKTAAAGKDHLALTLLGQIYERGVGNVIPRDSEAAAQCYTAAMEYGSVNAIYLAAQMHHTRGEYNTAIELYRTAADQGNVMANVMCARYALTGLGGVEKDQEKAFQV